MSLNLIRPLRNWLPASITGAHMLRRLLGWPVRIANSQSVMPEPETDRAYGVLLGTAAGDALGAGYEFTRPDTDAVIGMVGGGTFNWAPGEWTDDTSMAVAIALAAQGGELHTTDGQNAVAGRFRDWYDTNPKDVGRQTRSVLSRRSPTGRDMRAVASKIPGRKGGNGSLMRTAPVALAYLDDLDGCIEAATAIGSLTHNDQRANESCVLWTLAIRHAVLHGTYDGLREALVHVDAEYWAPRLDKAEASTDPRKDFPKNGWCVDALLTAWWAITHTSDLPSALEAAVRVGGDADTVAAITGGLVGARWGASCIPADWIAILHGYPGMNASDLITVTDHILAQR